MKLSSFPFEDQAWLVLRVGIAAVLGGIIGWERDRAGKTAGIRTHMLVASSAALAVGLGEIVLTRDGGGDPTRMMHAVFTGIGFIGGGMIWTQKRSRGPFGITSAATVVMVAGIGAACGLGAPLVGVAVTLFTLLTLSGVYAVENKLRARTGANAHQGLGGLGNDDLDATDEGDD
ncbi:MAG: MgtC/SapB family protein [Actinomycetota bacterium]|nr:MgtC/SapB family protein [Actinomycetota bacterium]